MYLKHVKETCGGQGCGYGEKPKISSSSNDESPLEGLRFCLTSSSSESASDVGGHGEQDLIGESDGGTGERSMCLRWCEELAEALSELCQGHPGIASRTKEEGSLHSKMTEIASYLRYHTTNLHGKTIERRRLLSDV